MFNVNILSYSYSQLILDGRVSASETEYLKTADVNGSCKEAMVKYILKNMKNGAGIRQGKYINSWKYWNSFYYDIYSFFQKINIFETCTFSRFGFI